MHKNIARFGIAALMGGVLLLMPFGMTAFADASVPSLPAGDSAGTIVSGGSPADPTGFQPLTDVTGTPFKDMFADTSNNGTGLQGFFQTLFTVAITIGGLLAVLEIAWGGWLYMTTDIVDKRGEAKTKIQNALLGLLMLLATVLILNQINPDITSLKLLTNGSGSSTTQAGTGTSGATAGQQAEGFGTYDPSGNYCVSSGVINGAQTDKPYYTCYTTDAACEQQNGSNSNCTGYSTSGAGYSPGVEHSSGTLPADAASYAQFSWVSNAGFDSNGNLNQCSTTAGTGWTEVAASMCGGAQASPLSECCGLSKAAAAAMAQATSTAAGEKFPADEQSSITTGNWCYIDSTDTYSCFTAKNACTTDLATALHAGAAPAGTACLVRISPTKWAVAHDASFAGYPYATAQDGQVCGIDTLAAQDDPTRQYACGFDSIAQCNAAVNGKLESCAQH